MDKYTKLIDFIRSIYKTDAFIPLHEPRFWGNEKKYLIECIDSTFVSSVGKFVDQIEANMAKYTGSKYAVAVVNGTAGLHIAMQLSGVKRDTEVITQPLTFIATANAISYCGASPIFLDVDKDTLGLSPEALKSFLMQFAKYDNVNKRTINKLSNKEITACLPMHTFGHPCRIDEIVEICEEYGIAVIEDAAESIGSYYQGKHTGTFASMGVFSFNGNKTITSGGGGFIITNDEKLAKLAKYITTTAKIPHKWEYRHDMIGYNYRMPNINAALAVAQLEQIDGFLASKRGIAQDYFNYGSHNDIQFVKEPENAKSNYWLNAVVLDNQDERDDFLKITNDSGVMTRPIWTLMSKLKMFENCQTDGVANAIWLEDRIVNIPSSVIGGLGDE
ncbi:MAG: LegC family aminotransferase [Candidatus Cloacimonetes bacterium]|nr:LegC family aminotransferase [Candidatus Cloacimonadota bacterium]